MDTVSAVLVGALVLHALFTVLVVWRLPLFDTVVLRTWVATVCVTAVVGFVAPAFVIWIQEVWVAPYKDWLRCQFVVRSVTRFDPQLVVYELIDKASRAISFWPRTDDDAVLNVGTEFTAYQNPASPTEILTSIKMSPLVQFVYLMCIMLTTMALFTFGVSMLSPTAVSAIRVCRRRLSAVEALPPPYAAAPQPPPTYVEHQT